MRIVKAFHAGAQGHYIGELAEGNRGAEGVDEALQIVPCLFCILGILREADLADAIRTGTIAGAGLEVFEYEPVRPDCPLLPLRIEVTDTTLEQVRGWRVPGPAEG